MSSISAQSIGQGSDPGPSGTPSPQTGAKDTPPSTDYSWLWTAGLVGGAYYAAYKWYYGSSPSYNTGYRGYRNNCGKSYNNHGRSKSYYNNCGTCGGKNKR